MKIKTSINDFNLDSKNQCLKGKIKNPKFNLGGARIEINAFPLIEGFVVELFSVTDIKQVEFRAEGIHFDVNDWYIRINIYSGWEHFEKGEINEFYIREREKVRSFDFDKNLNNSSSFLLQLKNMSARYFSNFYLDLRGGETSGVGRNEYGPAHFHVIENGTKKDLGRVYFPTIKEFNSKHKTELEFDNTCKIDRKVKKTISKWVFDPELKNLKDINNEWNLRNEFNNRIY
jgi:hypothetical protein